MTRVYLLRHGQVDAPAGLYGKTDVSVDSVTNTKIITELLKYEDYFTQVVSSPLNRCAELATKFSNQTNKTINIIDDFQEMNFGEFDGKSFDEIHKSDIQNSPNSLWRSLESFWQDPASNHLPNAELLTDFNQRISHAWEQLLKQYQGKAILLVTHGGVIRNIIAKILELDFGNPKLYSQLSIDYASVTCIEHFDETNISRVKNISMPLSALSIAKEPNT